MLNYHDEQRIKEIIQDTVPPIIEQRLDRLETKIDQILKIVSDDRQELTLTKIKVTQHSQRLTHIEQKLNITPPKSGFALA